MKEFKGYGSSVFIDEGNIIIKGKLGFKQEYRLKDIINITYTEPTVLKNGVLIIKTANEKSNIAFLKKNMSVLLELYNYLKDNTNLKQTGGKNNELNIIQDRQKALDDFKDAKKIGNFIYFDDVNKKFAIPKVSLFGKVQDISVYNYEDIINFELLEDGSSIAKGGLGRALVGGALFGEVGAVVGGVTGHRKTSGVCTELKIKITLNNIDNSVVYVNFITTKTKKSSSIYKEADKLSQEALSILDIITKQNAKTESDDNLKEQSSSADEIKKYKELLDIGAITQEEFEAKKKQLLGL